MRNGSSQGTDNLIGGDWVRGSGPGAIDVLDPSSGQKIASVQTSTPEDVDEAVQAAAAAQPLWGSLTPADRSAVLHQLVSLVEEHVDELVGIEVADAGKPVSAARISEFPAVLDAMRHFAGAARGLSAQPAGEYASGVTAYTRREPVGVVAAITPWNYPLWQAVWKIMPALAAGNAVVIKPAENTPLSTTRFAALARDVLPAGVLNVVHGYGDPVGKALTEHERVDLISFTGSTATGRGIARAAAEGPRRLILELGGNAPVLVFDDADVDAAAESIVQNGLYNAGQECMAASRVLAAESIAGALAERVQDLMGKVRVGQTTDPDTVLGPLISARQRDRVERMLERMPGHAKVLYGGGRPDLPGFFLQPTLLVGLEQQDELVQEEIFGPVITMQTFEDEEQALSLANGVPFGLAASVWTQRVGRALRASRDLHFGNVWVNTHLIVSPDGPIGGFGASGYGKEGGTLGIEEFTRVKQVGISLG